MILEIYRYILKEYKRVNFCKQIHNSKFQRLSQNFAVLILPILIPVKEKNELKFLFSNYFVESQNVRTPFKVLQRSLKIKVQVNFYFYKNL